MLGSPFERFVAWRHLRDPESRRWGALVFGAGLLLLALGCGIAGALFKSGAQEPDGFMRAGPLVWAGRCPSGHRLRCVGTPGGVLGVVAPLFSRFYGCFGVLRVPWNGPSRLSPCP